MTPAEHAEATAEWRAERDRGLRNPDGWLTLVGLHWLHPGENRFGADPANEIVLAGAGIPPLAGSLWRDGTRVHFVPASPRLTLAADLDQPAGAQDLTDDADGPPTVLAIGDLRFHTIRRGDRIGLRVRHWNAPALLGFTGMTHFPVDASWRVTGHLDVAPPGATARITDITGEAQDLPYRGEFAFERDGAVHRLTALEDGDDGSLWLIFADGTSGAETYAGGRFLATDPVAADGSVVADFNRAYNPPCVFSPYATCPMPPPQNRLPIRVEAGELVYHPAT
jgi:uncharacterized protein (DUF1684 family)